MSFDTFDSWRNQRQDSLFAIIDATLDTTAVARFYDTGGKDAYPLFATTAFSDHAEQGPWLLPFPSTDFVNHVLPLSGFYITSYATVEIVRQHWQSLIEVARNGEVMWLRYADPRLFPKMFAAMSQTERDQILGPCSGLWANAQGWLRSPDYEFIPQISPWFRIQPQHLAHLYDEARHVYTLYRHLWQRIEPIMTRHTDPQTTIAAVLQRANLDGLDGDIRDGVVAATLALQINMPLDAIQTPLMLSDNELTFVKHWLNKYCIFTGVV
ncbi:MAG: DUF4123 domain-containing protein [Plesiomonas sp.]|uniref:DUF4123 domain-containing protein n=1 Tax=Plesiomonas sp. TaxID=2486279 RepID=UPI003F2DDCAC